MPPKEAAIKKPPPQTTRPTISDCSLLYVPEDAIEGYQERIETGIEWTLVEEAARYHKRICQQDIPTVTFSNALENKLRHSIFHGFLDESSPMSLDEHWELMLPITLWDNEKMANEEGKICFHSVNCITDDIVKLIKRAVKVGNRGALREDLKTVNVLRVNDSKMTILDEGMEFKNLVSLNLCGNFICEFDARFLPASVRSIELQANRITSVAPFAEFLPAELLYLGLARNCFTNETVEGLERLPQHLTVLDLSNNDIYHLDPLLEALWHLPSLVGLQLEGNPCSVSAAYARATLNKLQHLKWLDSREILPTDRAKDPIEIHHDDLRSAYFCFTVYRVMSAPMPPKPEKGAITTFHVELEIPLLDVARRRFLMFRRNESLTEMLPPAEDEEWPPYSAPSNAVDSKLAISIQDETSSHESDIYNRLTTKSSREIRHYTTLESNRVQWNKTLTTKATKADKKSVHSMKAPAEQRVVLATIKCALKTLDWSQPAQHFHWDDSLGTDEAIHWGDGDLSVLQYSQGPVKTAKGKPETDSRQAAPDNLTCHFGFGIETLRSVENVVGLASKNKKGS